VEGKKREKKKAKINTWCAVSVRAAMTGGTAAVAVAASSGWKKIKVFPRASVFGGHTIFMYIYISLSWSGFVFSPEIGPFKTHIYLSIYHIIYNIRQTM